MKLQIQRTESPLNFYILVKSQWFQNAAKPKRVNIYSKSREITTSTKFRETKARSIFFKSREIAMVSKFRETKARTNNILFKIS